MRSSPRSRSIQSKARRVGILRARPHWPMIILRTPKGWTGPKKVDGLPVEGHVPRRTRCPWPAWPIGRSTSECWNGGCGATARRSCSTRPGGSGRTWPDWRPRATRRMGANPHANGGSLLRDLRLPDFRDYAVDVPAPGAVDAEATRRPGRVHPRRAEAQRRPAELPRLQPRRDRLEPLDRRLRGHRPRLDGPGAARRRPRRRATAG